MHPSGQLSTVLALICSEPDRDEIELDGRTFYVAKSDRRLPQGAPSSPAITNIICRGLDARLTRIAEQLGFRYTRYADDITFSGSGEAVSHIGRALRQIEHVVNHEGFQLHPDKTRVLRRSSRQEVTGLVVNDGISVRRDLLRQFRAVLFQIDRDGPVGKRWGQSSNVMYAIEGFANFIAMVDPEKGATFQDQVAAIHNRYGRGRLNFQIRSRWADRKVSRAQSAPLAATEAVDQSSSEAVDHGQEAAPQATKKKPWWKFW